jgi:hypothetical protein
MRLDRRFLMAVLLGALCAIGPTAMAADEGWDGIDAGTRGLLSAWKDGWITISSVERERLLANARRWQAMDPAARKDLLKRSAQWQALPAAERARQRERYAAWKALGVDEQARLRAAAARFVALPVPQQGALRASFGTLAAGQQEGWLYGTATGAWIGKANDAFAYVPDHEREATLRMLQDLAPDARDQLFVLAARLPADAREHLRRDLLLLPPRQRPDLIRQRLAQ